LGDWRNVLETTGLVLGQKLAQGDYAAVEAEASAALSVSREANFQHGTRTFLSLLGKVMLAQGEFHVTRSHFNNGIQVLKEAGFQRHASYFYICLGLVAYASDEIEEVRRHLIESLREGRHLTAVAQSLPAAVVAQAEARGRSLDVKEVAAELLAELRDLESGTSGDEEMGRSPDSLID
jgi:hypothetical protein